MGVMVRRAMAREKKGSQLRLGPLPFHKGRGARWDTSTPHTPPLYHYRGSVCGGVSVQGEWGTHYYIKLKVGVMVRRGAMAREEKGRQSVKSGSPPFSQGKGRAMAHKHTTHTTLVSLQRQCVWWCQCSQGEWLTHYYIKLKVGVGERGRRGGRPSPVGTQTRGFAINKGGKVGVW